MVRLLPLALMLPALATLQTAPMLAQSDEIVVKVSDPNHAADVLVASVEEAGGYFSARSDSAVTLKVPLARRVEILAKAEAMGEVIRRNHASRDLGPTLEEWRTLLASRRTVLQRYYAVIGDAGPSAVVTVEREMTSLVQGIEQLQGQIRLAEHQLAFAQIAVHFEFRDRTPPVRDGSSSFAWLNTLNIADLIAEFSHED